jgi:hypothetical protein
MSKCLNVECRVHGSGSGANVTEFRVYSLPIGYRTWGLGIQVSSLGGEVLV